MMDFSPTPPRKQARENIVPMINVVFLLLIFFLMSAQITPPEPFDVVVPNSADGIEDAQADVFFVAQNGRVAFGGAAGEDAWTALQARTSTETLFVRADADLPAQDLAKLLPRLAQMGITRTALVTGGP